MRRPARLRLTVTRRLPETVQARMAALFDARLNAEDRPFSRDELISAIGQCDILAPTVTDTIDAGLIARAGSRLRLIANFGAGTDHIDLAAAQAKAIAVTNTPGVLTEDTADLVIALILTASRRFGEGERLLRAGRWSGWAPTAHLGRSMSGLALGIAGMGRIGQGVARRARAFGMRVHYHNRTRLACDLERALDARYWASLDEMLPSIDILSVNTPYGAATHNLIDARRLSLMKSDSYLINTARGAVVDQGALIAALQAGRIAGAGLDVYPDEPRVDPRLIAMEKVVLLPHLGSATIEARTAMGEKVIANAVAFAEGRALPDRVV